MHSVYLEGPTEKIRNSKADFICLSDFDINE